MASYARRVFDVLRRLVAPLGLALLAGLAPSLAQQPSAAAPAPTPAPSPYTLGGTTFSGMAEGYADYNFDSPASGLNSLQNFDYLANTAQFSFAQQQGQQILLSRVEVRDDWSNQAFFASNTGLSRQQPTVLLGLVATVGPCN